MVFPFSFWKKSGNITPTAITVVRDALYIQVSWTTATPATSKVQYGTTTGYLETPVTDATLTTNHVVVINKNGAGLNENTLYHFKVGDIAGTATSADQTTTTYILTLLDLSAVPNDSGCLGVGPFASLVAPAASGLSDQNTTTLASGDISIPSKWNRVHLSGGAFLGSNNSREVWAWISDLQLLSGSSIISDGHPGGDAVNECCTAWAGGDGGEGASGGGGGAASDFCGCGAQGGEAGNGGNGGYNGGASGNCGTVGGSGGQGDGYSYNGFDFLGHLCQSLDPQPGGNGGDATAGTGAGGGGGSGFEQGILCNSFTNSFTGHLSSRGGAAGSGTNCSPGNPGADGTVVVFTRKYDASLGNLYASQSFIIEITGNYQTGFAVGNIYNGAGAVPAFDHLYQP